jgi:hypothetical protein
MQYRLHTETNEQVLTEIKGEDFEQFYINF